MTDPTRTAARFHTAVTRRVIGSLAALALAGGIAAGPALSAAAATTRSSAAVRTTPSNASEFATSLSAAQLAALFDGIPNASGTGLRLGDLTPTQRAAAFDVLRGLLSEQAWAQLSELLAADAELDADAGGGSAWSADHYRLALFGDPGGDYVLQFSTADVVLSAIRQGDAVDVRPDVVA